MAWKDDEISSSSGEEQAYMALITLHNFDDEDNEVSDLEPSYNELHAAFLELYA